MREKKVRGIKRKTNQMMKFIEEETVKFPTEFHNGYWRMLLPIAQNVIASGKTPNKIKRLCIQTLLNQVDHLIRLKPNDESKYRVVALVNLPDLWYSQIIVFKGDSYYKDFFNRNNEVQKWLRLSDSRNIQMEWGLSVLPDFQMLGYKEVITDEDGYYKGEIWFIGECHDN